LNGIIYENNSMVNLSTIGIDSRALICISPCCEIKANLKNHEWVLPNGNIVTDGPGWSSYERPSLTFLNHDGMFKTQTGVYTCKGRNLNNEEERMYILGYTNKIPGTALIMSNLMALGKTHPISFHTKP